VEREGLEHVNDELRAMYEEYLTAISSGELDRAMGIGLSMLDKLLKVAKDTVLTRITTPAAREAALSVLSHHERALSFVRGAQEAVGSLPPVYSIGVKEEVLEVLTSSINGLFSFVLGALVVIADIVAAASTREIG